MAPEYVARRGKRAPTHPGAVLKNAVHRPNGHVRAVSLAGGEFRAAISMATTNK